jgi:hypothetical protein
VVNKPGCFSTSSSFSVSNAGCGTNTNTIAVRCKGWVKGVPTYSLSIVFKNTLPTAGGLQCTTNMTAITSTTGAVAGISPAMPAVIPIGGSTPTITFDYTPTNSTATTANFTYLGNWNDPLSNSASFQDLGVKLPSCICDACTTTIKLTVGATSNTVAGNNWNIKQVITPSAPGLTLVAAKAEIVSFERYVGDSCVDCNKDAALWGNFKGGTLGNNNGSFATANNGISGNTHHTIYWQAPALAGPLTSGFNLNVSIPTLINLTCCCDRIVATIRYTGTFKADNGQCTTCSVLRTYQFRKGNCGKQTDDGFTPADPIKDFVPIKD